jgi:hypothetical protein
MRRCSIKHNAAGHFLGDTIPLLIAVWKGCEKTGKAGTIQKNGVILFCAKTLLKV